MNEIHECEVLEKTTVAITVEKINNQWLWVFHEENKNPVAHGIKYCPYCGAELIK